MKLNAGIVTEKLSETKDFYTEVLGMGVRVSFSLWGDRHFAIQDPNGIGIDIFKYIQNKK